MATIYSPTAHPWEWYILSAFQQGHSQFVIYVTMLNKDEMIHCVYFLSGKHFCLLIWLYRESKKNDSSRMKLMKDLCTIFINYTNINYTTYKLHKFSCGKLNDMNKWVRETGKLKIKTIPISVILLYIKLLYKIII